MKVKRIKLDGIQGLEMETRREWKAFCEARQYPIHGRIDSKITTVEVPAEITSRLLTSSAAIPTDHNINGLELLNAIRKLDGWSADRLSCRDASLSDFKFRVLHEIPPSPDKKKEADILNVSSYIAVSYCWHYDTWEPALGLQSPSIKSGRGQKPPLMPAMFAAILDERASQTEPLWIDQCCIDQSNEEEKSVAIGVMDLLYSNARVVTVCLEDVRLSVKDMTTLLEFSTYLEERKTPNLESISRLEELKWAGKEGHLFEAVTKIFTARWFSRAWCAHEFWMGNSIVFLVPITTDPTGSVSEDASTTIIRFNSAFLGIAHFLTARWIPGDEASSTEKKWKHWEEHVKNSHEYFHAGIFDFGSGQLRTRTSVTHALKYFGGFRAERIVPSHQETFAVVNAMESFNLADKLAITLNVGQTGLKLNLPGGSSLSSAEIAWIATIVALASGDPTVLAATGPSISSLGTIETKQLDEYGWANVPEVDRFLRIEDQEKHAPLPVEIKKHGLALDVVRLGKSSQLKDPDPIKTNMGIVAIKWLCEQDTEYPLHLGNALRRRHLISALGCLITGGANWTIACAISLQLQPASLLIHLNIAENMHLIDSAFQAVDSLVFLPVSPDSTSLKVDFESSKAILDEKHRAQDILPGIRALVMVANGLVKMVVGEEVEYRENEISETDQIQVCVSNIAGHGGIVIFGPPSSEIEYELVCPNVLRKTTQIGKNMRKGWIVQKKLVAGQGLGDSVRDEPQRYRLLGKTALFMPLATDTDDPFAIYHPERIVVGHS